MQYSRYAELQYRKYYCKYCIFPGFELLSSQINNPLRYSQSRKNIKERIKNELSKMFNKVFDGAKQLLEETDSAKKLAIRTVLLFTFSIIAGGIFTGAMIWTNQDKVVEYILSRQGNPEFRDIVLSRVDILKTFNNFVGARIIGVAEYQGGYSEVIWLSDGQVASDLLGVNIGTTTSISSAIDRYNSHLRGKCYAEPRAAKDNTVVWIITVPIFSEGRLQGYLGAALTTEISSEIQKRTLSIGDAKETYCPNLYVAASYLTRSGY